MLGQYKEWKQIQGLGCINTFEHPMTKDIIILIKRNEYEVLYNNKLLYANSSQSLAEKKMFKIMDNNP